MLVHIGDCVSKFPYCFRFRNINFRFDIIPKEKTEGNDLRRASSHSKKARLPIHRSWYVWFDQSLTGQENLGAHHLCWKTIRFSNSCCFSVTIPRIPGLLVGSFHIDTLNRLCYYYRINLECPLWIGRWYVNLHPVNTFFINNNRWCWSFTVEYLN